jgi:hypothetical protein
VLKGVFRAEDGVACPHVVVPDSLVLEAVEGEVPFLKEDI